MTSPSAPPPRSSVWVLTDDVVGHASQSLGVAEALAVPFERCDVRYGSLAALPWTLGPHALAGLDAASRAKLTPPWPDLVIATGRRLGAVARWIKRRARRDDHPTRLVQIMDPVSGREDFDLIAAPRHDRTPPRANLMETTGAPNRITPDRLAVEGARWRDRLESLPSPRIAVLVGGATRRRGFSPVLAAELGGFASALAHGAGGSLMITTSRRTGEEAAAALAQSITVPAYIHRWNEAQTRNDGNPYFAFLALCDAVIVTGESMSMCSEACATGKPVYIFAPAAIIKPAFARLHQELYDLGMARPLNHDAHEPFAPWHYAPLSAAQDIAAEIRKRRLLGDSPHGRQKFA